MLLSNRRLFLSLMKELRGTASKVLVCIKSMTPLGVELVLVGKWRTSLKLNLIELSEVGTPG